MSRPEQPASQILGIECGGTRSVAVLTQVNGSEAVQFETGPANLRLLNDQDLVAHFRKISAVHQKSGDPAVVAIGMAGARTTADRERIRSAAGKVWPKATCYATNDLETALSAAEAPSDEQLPRVLLISGTGSCTFGQTPDGKTMRVGGWGHILGDKGSGYEIGLRGLKAVVYYYDRDGKWPALGQQLLRTLQLNEPNDLIGWILNASKSDIAATAVEVFKAWEKKDPIAIDILSGAAENLAADATTCAQRMVKKGTKVHFIFSGSTLVKAPKFAAEVEKRIRKLWPKALVTVLNRESVWGAVELAKKQLGAGGNVPAKNVKLQSSFGKTPVVSKDLPMTERRNPASLNLDQLPVEEMISLMLREDEKIPAAIFAEREKIARAVRLITKAFKTGGRLFYIGAGTSGRLGVLDASECPPTFRSSPEMVQGIIAGGQTALWKAVEGAEDDYSAGAEAIRFNEITKKDVVIGIAASGRTPFVWGAIEEAKTRKAKTAIICFNPTIEVPAKHRPNIIIAPDVGPEVLTGSTRLKAGTATKLILNMLTTLSMVKLGKVVSNLMVDLNPSNVKLRDRAVRIVQEITGADADTAKAALEKNRWAVKETCQQLRKTHKTSPTLRVPYQVQPSSAPKSSSALRL